MTEEELVALFGLENNYLVEAIEDALGIIELQVTQPDVYGLKTQKSLDQCAALVALFKSKYAEMRIKGNKDGATYLRGLYSGMEDIMASLKYKINANK